MDVSVRLFGTPSGNLRDKSYAFQLEEGATFKDLQRAIKQSWKRVLPPVFWNERSEELVGVILIVDGRTVYDVESPLRDNKEISLVMPSVCG